MTLPQEHALPHQWNPALYDGPHRFVTKYGESLLEWLRPLNGEAILDAGCGTGDLARNIALSGASVTGVDSSAAMIREAQKKYPEIDFQVQDVRALPFQNRFDAVFSNAALHWVKEADRAVSSIYRALKPGGRFVAELGGKDNLHTISKGIGQVLDRFGFSGNKAKNPWYFPGPAEYAALLEQEGFIVRAMVYFDRPTPLNDGEQGLRQWLKMFAGVFFEGVPASIREEMVLALEKELRPALFKDGTWFADYKRLRLQAEKFPN